MYTTEITQVSPAILANISPFLPFFIDTAKHSTKTLSDVIAHKGGDALWIKAQALWKTIKGWFYSSPKIETAALSLSHDPLDQDFQNKLAKHIGIPLQNNPGSLEEIITLLGGQQSTQQVLADKGSFVEQVLILVLTLSISILSQQFWQACWLKI
jgi:hypothetical protein